MNGIVYMIDKEKRQSGIRLFVSKSEFDRSVSTVVKGAETVRTIIFPSTTKKILVGAFEDNKYLRSVVLNEGLERIEGDSSDE